MGASTARGPVAAPVDEWAITSARVGELFRAGLIDAKTLQVMGAAVHAYAEREARRAAVRPPPLPVRERLADAIEGWESGSEGPGVGEAGIASEALGAAGVDTAVPPPPPVASEFGPVAAVAPDVPQAFSPLPRPGPEPARPLAKKRATMLALVEGLREWD